MEIIIQERVGSIREMIRTLKGELDKIARGYPINKVLIETLKKGIFFSGQEHYIALQNELEATQKEAFNQKIQEKIERLIGLAQWYYKCFEHYWNCYKIGDDLAKEEFVAYGESYTTIILEILKLIEHLFHLTTRESIVQ